MEFSDEERIQEKGVEGSSVQAEEAMLSDQNKTTVLRGSTKTQDLEEQCWVIHISQKFKISIKKHLIPLRIALFCWYGAGSIPLNYLSVFMKQKGLSLVEYSSILSVTFVFQFLTAFLSGIVADKIGNVKPVLVFHVVVTMLMILTFLLIPDINTCENQHHNGTQSYDENSVEYIAGQKKDIIDKTLERDLVNVSQFNKTNILNYENFSKYPLPNVTNFVGGDDKENFTAVNIKYILSKCGSHKKTFYVLYAISTLVFLSSWSTVYRLMDVTAMLLVGKYNSSFGYERFFSMTGNVVVTFATGIVLNAFSSVEENNYQSVYWFCFSIMCLVLVAVCSIKIHIKPPSRNMWKKSISLMRNGNVQVFVVIIFVTGTISCFFYNFTMWFLEEINASTVVIGHQQTLSALCGLPFLLTSKWWLKVFGSEILFIGAFLGNFIYGIGYSFLYDPWWTLLVELTTIFTYHLLWVAVIVHSHHTAPEEITSTVIAIAGGIHFGFGRSAGVFTGGMILNAVGSRVTCRIFAGASLAAAVLYASFLYCRRRRTRGMIKTNISCNLGDKSIAPVEEAVFLQEGLQQNSYSAKNTFHQSSD